MSNENLSKRHGDPLLQRIHDDLLAMKALQEEQKALQEEQKATLDEMKDILVVWNNTKGFINTVRFIGTVLKWVVGVGTAIGLIYYWIRH